MNVYFLYSIIFLFAVFFAYCADRKYATTNSFRRSSGFNKTPYLLSFIVLCLFIVFTDTGADYYSYLYHIESGHDFSDIINQRDIEPLFTLWAHYGWQAFQNGHLIIVTMKVVTILVMFLSFNLLRKEIDVFSAICAYASISYLTSFSLIRIVLASAFVTLAFSLLLKNKKIIWVILCMAIAIGLHFSCIMPFFALATYYVAFRYGGTNNRKFLIVLLVLAILIAMTQATTLMNMFIASSESFEHYQKYVDRMNASFSIGVLALLIISYSLIFYLLNKARKWERDNSRYFLMLVFSIFALIFEVVGNYVPVMERVIYNYIAVYCIVLPYCLNLYRLNSSRGNVRLMTIIVFTFFVFKFYFSIRSRALPESSSGLYYYHFFNPFAT